MRSGDLDEWIRSLVVPFLAQVDEESLRHWRAHLEVERAWSVLDEGRSVGTCCVLTRDVSLPGLADEPCPTSAMAAISAVGVHATHRRQGLLRRMMGAMLADAMDRGEPIAGLFASEASIYGRFGFGWATSSVRLTLPRRTTRITNRAADLDLKLCDPEEAGQHLPKLFARLRLGRPGQVDRNEPYWSDMFVPRTHPSRGSQRFFAACDEGYVSYRSLPGSLSEPTVLRVDDLFGATPEIEAGLWQFVLGVDLVDSIVANRPVDEPFRWRLEDPRSLAVTALNDSLWIRILDVPAALTSRRYRSEGSLVFEVEPAPTWVNADGEPEPDPAAGRWVLEAGRTGSSCRRALASEQSELRLGVADLGSALLGGQDLISRSAAGRVQQLVPGSLLRADTLFETRPLPFSSTGF